MARQGHQLGAVLDHVPDLIAVLERDGTVRTLAGRVEPVLGPAWELALGRNLRDLAHPDDADAVGAFVAAVADRRHDEQHRAEWRLLGAGGMTTSVEGIATSRLGDPSLDGLVVTIRDVQDRKTVEAHLRHRAQHDDLTGLPARALFYDRLERALSGAAAATRVGLLFVDLDDFKALNDERGHATGDAVLVEAARRLRACLRQSDTAARLGGDEFAILLEGVSGPNEPVQVAQRILAVLKPPFGDGTVVVQASLGVALSEPGEDDVDDLLRRADLAMYAAKRRGKHRWELYHRSLEPDRRDGSDASVVREGPASWFARSNDQRDQVLALLARDDVITPSFQAIVDLRTGLLAGYEALSRFAPPFRRPPNEWFEQGHRCGLGARLETKAVLAALAVPDRSPGVWLSINLSPAALTSPEIAHALPARLDGLVLEINDSEHISDVGPITAAIAGLRARGARIALDDVGSGYGGLQHVIRLAPDMIKLDRSLVAGVHADPGRAALIEAFVRYAREIDAAVCAEGIETLADLERLAELDVTFGQGWAIGRPERPWKPVAAEATAACHNTISRTLRQVSGDGAHARDGRVEWLVARLASATCYADVTAALDPIAHALRADEVAVSAVDGEDLVMIGASGPQASDERYRIRDFPATARALATMEAVQILAGDPRADDAELRLLHERGFHSLLMLPLVCGDATIGLFEASNVSGRPWSRYDVSRARIISLQLGAALERIRRAA